MPSASSITQRADKAAKGAAYHRLMSQDQTFFYKSLIGYPSDEFIAQLEIIQNYYTKVIEAADRAREAVRKGQINKAERYVKDAENTLDQMSVASVDLSNILEDDDFSMILTGDREIASIYNKSLYNNPADRRQNGGPAARILAAAKAANARMDARTEADEAARASVEAVQAVARADADAAKAAAARAAFHARAAARAAVAADAAAAATDDRAARAAAVAAVAAAEDAAAWAEEAAYAAR